MKKLVGLLSVVLILSSCMKEKDDVYPVVTIPEGTKTGSTGNKDTYQYWSYYSLKDNAVVKLVDKGSWDLGFTCTDSFQIILNTANMAFVGNSGKTDFTQVTSAAGLTMNFDASSGNPDSNAIGKWYRDSSGVIVSKYLVYVLDRGVDVDGNSLGFKKVQFVAVTNNDYTVRFSNMNGADDHTVVVPREASKNYTGLSFSSGGSAVTIEPDKDKWDILLGQYTTMLFSDGAPYPYIVTGGTLNPNKVTALELTNTVFATVNSQNFGNYTLSNKHDAIGYLWKIYSINAGKYTMIDNLTYLVKGVDGSKYKFRFIDFYDQNGNKGYPTFEFMKIF